METATILVGAIELRFYRDSRGKIRLLSKIDISRNRYNPEELFIPKIQYLAALRRAAKKLSFQKTSLPATKQLPLF